jgi:hypothetical protein
MWGDFRRFILGALEIRSVLIPTPLGELVCQASVEQLIVETVDHLEHLLFHGVFQRVVHRYFLLFLVLHRRFLKDVLPDERAVGRAHRVRIL